MRICLISLILLMQLQNPISAQRNLDSLLYILKTQYPSWSEKTRDGKFDRFVENIRSKNQADTFYTLSKVVTYFNDGHLILYKYPLASPDSIQCSKNLAAVKSYFQNRKINQSNLEGYWINDYNTCVIALKKSSIAPWDMIGYVMESRNNTLLPGQDCLSMEKLTGSEYLTDYTDDDGAFKIYLKSHFKSDSIFTTGAYAKWRKLKSYEGPILKALPAFSFQASSQKIDDNNYLIRIPANNRTNTQIVDSIVRADSVIISKTKNLIVDIRNNLGGTIRTYFPLLPFVYTNPIVAVLGQTYSTDSTIAQAKRSFGRFKAIHPEDTARIKILENFVKRLENNKGSFVPPQTAPSKEDTIYFKKILPFPKNVAVIMNYACQSAAEMMVLNFKQSTKVTAFGENTKGAVDNLEFFPILLPDKTYMLYMPSAMRIIPKGEKHLEGSGIRPDIPISENVSDWVDFVKKYYENR